MVGAKQALASALALFLAVASRAGMSAVQHRPTLPDANDCLVWIANSLLANPWYQVAKNDCTCAIRIEDRYETDVGTGCFGPASCGSVLMPDEIR